MPISAPGSNGLRGRGTMRRIARGFTLIELMVVVAIIAIGAGVATLALRDPAETQLQREAARLSALLEVARTQARGLGVTVVWSPITADEARRSGNGTDRQTAQFRFDGLPDGQELPTRWLNPQVTAEIPQVGGRIVLGPEPLIPAQRIVLRLDEQRLGLATDGLGPFVVGNQDADHSAPAN